MALRNGNAVTNLMLQRDAAATKVSKPKRGQPGLLQLALHPVLRIRTVVLMYVW